MEVKKLNDFSLHTFGNQIEITGMVMGDLIVPFPTGTQTDYKLLKLTHDEWKILLQQLDTLETTMFPNDKTGLAKVIMRKSQRHIEQSVSWNVFRRDGYKCRYCGAHTVPLTVDHLVLWEDMGPSVEQNLLSACRKCNKARGNMPYLEWLECDYYTEKRKGISEEDHILNEIAWDTAQTVLKRTNKRNR